MRDLERQTILVTGATDGLGKRVASHLARRGATVLLHGRSEQRLRATTEEVRAQTGSERLRPYRADFSSLGEVRGLAGRILTQEERLDVLVNNAGIIASGPGESEDGYELTFAVNYLSHYLLTRLLVPLLREHAPARIVNVASDAQSPVDFEDLMLGRDFDAMRAYSQSKLAQVMFTIELSGRLTETAVSVNALHPATLMGTKMVDEAFGYTRATIEEGADATVRLIASPELQGVTGRYFDGQREGRAEGQAYDETARKELWDLSERLCGPFLEPLTFRR